MNGIKHMDTTCFDEFSYHSIYFRSSRYYEPVLRHRHASPEDGLRQAGSRTLGESESKKAGLTMTDVHKVSWTGESAGEENGGQLLISFVLIRTRQSVSLLFFDQHQCLILDELCNERETLPGSAYSCVL